MGRNVSDKVGRRFGRLVVLRQDGFIGRNSAFICLCDCGVEKRIAGHTLGTTQSCGCLHRERASERVKKNPPRLKHGLSGSSTYSSWQCMVSRVTNPKDTNYPRYGGRGITICLRWSDPDKGFENFVEDMGHRPTSAHSIDRKESEKGYEPGNCRWCTRAQQNQNVKLKSSNSTGYKGINKRANKWLASIRSNGKRYYLGSYNTKNGAALAYNIASEKLHGEYGHRNVLPDMSRKTTRIVTEKVLKRIKEIL